MRSNDSTIAAPQNEFASAEGAAQLALEPTS
jgi:hypothetical protein